MRAIYISLLLLCIGLCGCATTIVNAHQSTTGTDFNEANVGQIRKGTTTANQIVAFFGQPQSEEILSPNQVMWHYSYQSTFYTDTVTQMVAEVKQTTGYEKKLEILMQDDVVINSAYVKAPINDVKNIPAQ